MFHKKEQISQAAEQATVSFLRSTLLQPYCSHSSASKKMELNRECQVVIEK
jgi:hypothetical protein